MEQSVSCGNHQFKWGSPGQPFGRNSGDGGCDVDVDIVVVDGVVVDVVVDDVVVGDVVGEGSVVLWEHCTLDAKLQP